MQILRREDIVMYNRKMWKIIGFLVGIVIIIFLVYGYMTLPKVMIIRYGLWLFVTILSILFFLRRVVFPKIGR
jgi:hypothetical protein